MLVIDVQDGLRSASDVALANFTKANPTWHGAAWADVLDVLIDSDASIELVEAVFEDLEFEDQLTDEVRPYVGAVTLTLAWAFAPLHLDPNAGDVLAGIRTVLAWKEATA